jgi:hypothetical protein
VLHATQALPGASFWLSQLDLAYTLPFLGRIDEAKEHVAALLKTYPTMTIREADAFYKLRVFRRRLPREDGRRVTASGRIRVSLEAGRQPEGRGPSTCESARSGAGRVTEKSTISCQIGGACGIVFQKGATRWLALLSARATRALATARSEKESKLLKTNNSAKCPDFAHQ